VAAAPGDTDFIRRGAGMIPLTFPAISEAQAPISPA
jgi:hypothetical protein